MLQMTVSGSENSFMEGTLTNQEGKVTKMRGKKGLFNSRKDSLTHKKMHMKLK